MKRIIIDIETISNLFVLCGVDADSDKKFHFVLWKGRNELDRIIKFLEWSFQNEIIHITFNGLAFDSQILQWLYNSRDKFVNLYTEEIINLIYKKAQETIQRSNMGEWNEFPEWKLLIPQQDIFKMNHWDNMAKSASLKWLQCSMDWPNLQDMPYQHNDYIETEEQLGEVIIYCYNDCFATKKVFELSKEGVELRKDLTNEYGINLNSASEMRMAKELFLHFLSQKTGIEKKELKKYSTQRDTIEVNKLLVNYLNFERQEFIMLLNNFKKLVINGTELRGAFKYKVKYRGIEIDYGVGGVHGFSEQKTYKSDDNHIIMDSDISSFYPNLTIKNKWSPAHINKQAFCEQYEWFYKERKKEKKGSAKNKAWKLILNGTFGLSIDKNSFLSDSQLGVTIVCNGQLTITLLLEMICEAIPEAQPLVMNTDSVNIRIPRKYEQLYMDTCKKWESITQLELEHDKYKSLFAFDCNSYIGQFENGEIKCKGRFEFEAHDKYKIDVLHKNKSFLIVCKGIYEYFVNGVEVEAFVRSHRNIYDFCGFARAKGKWKFIQVTGTGEGVIEKPIQKTLRYFVSNTGSKVIKRNSDDKREIQVLAGRRHITEFNKFWEKEWDDYNIDYSFYIKEIYKEIHVLEKPQMSLF